LHPAMMNSLGADSFSIEEACWCLQSYNNFLIKLLNPQIKGAKIGK